MLGPQNFPPDYYHQLQTIVLQAHANSLFIINYMQARSRFFKLVVMCSYLINYRFNNLTATIVEIFRYTFMQCITWDYYDAVITAH